MPEYPDITIYLERLQALLAGRPLERIRIRSPFLLRTVQPPLNSIEGLEIISFERLGKRLVLGFPREHYLVLHLMIAGRLHWRAAGAGIPGKRGLAALDFAHGTLLLTEAGTRKRAALHLVVGRSRLADFQRGGVDVFTASEGQFRRALQRENHTLKRALVDPRILDGIGNAYSDEILHRARLSPLALTQKLGEQELRRLQRGAREVLQEWVDQLRREVGDGFPEKVTAFRQGMAVHGRFGQPCLVCGTAVQRIRYASNETNYCPVCQTAGRLLADRALSRLLKSDWPRSLDALEELTGDAPDSTKKTDAKRTVDA